MFAPARPAPEAAIVTVPETRAAAPNPIRLTALAAHEAGVCALPAREDASKVPDAGAWKQYQERLPTVEELGDWFGEGTTRTGIGFVMGAVSGGLECLDFDDREWEQDYCRLAVDVGLTDLVSRVWDGYTEQTPNGVHVVYRVAGAVGGNLKLAATADKGVKIETRSEGGWIVAAPSHGAVHASGEPYVLISGGLDQIATITLEERELLHGLARSMDQTPEPVAAPSVPTGPAKDDAPGSLYNNDDSVTTTQLMTGAGWTLVSSRGGTDNLRRPGKDGGISATVGHIAPGILRVFTTSTDFEAKSYDKFGAFAVLYHGGDHSEAGKALYRDFEQYRAPAPDPLTASPALAARVVRIDHGADGQAEIDSPTTAPRPVSGIVPGGDFVLDAPTTVPAIWGEGDQVGWAEGETLAIVGPEGTGKSTLAQQLVYGRVGLRPTVLGFPVAESSSRVLYLAMDRPAQIARSMRRGVREEDRALLNERLVVQRGPLAADVAANPPSLLDLAVAVGADTIVVDSLKDLAMQIGKEETGAPLNRAFQLCLAEGVEVVVVNHMRKSQGQNKKPDTLDDVYGSRMLTAGMGSVLLIWGEPGDLALELSQLKSPAERVGPLDIILEPDTGTFTVDRSERVNAVEFVRQQPSGECTVRAWANYRFSDFEAADPRKQRSHTQAARRELDGLHKRKLLDKRDGAVGGAGGGTATVYFDRRSGASS